MDNDKKTKVVKFLKIMAAYFVLYLIHFVIYPNTPFYTNSDSDKFMWGWSLFLFPFFDIFILESNFAYGCIGIALYDCCAYIYSAEGAYDIGHSRVFDTGPFSYEALRFDLMLLTIVYLVIYIILFIIVFVVEVTRKHIKNKKDKEEKN